MTPQSLTLELDGHRLFVVPSVHFRLPFAEEVNTLCRKVRPGAVAIELGPQMAGSLWHWLKELEIGKRSHSVRLPCMLALTKPNRLIHPDLRERAARLQELAGVDVSELPPEVLKEALMYSAVSVLYLSPTDSIIEASRCALELDVPLYGVDLEESAERRMTPARFQDPSLSGGVIDDYVRRNEGFADCQRDAPIDDRRELAMAARLKRLSAEFASVVFVCGLAHWRRLRSLWRDATLRPAPVTVAHETQLADCRRVIVHPVLAIPHIDQFPAFADAYERHRASAIERKETSIRDPVDVQKLFFEMLQASYLAHFNRQTCGQYDRNLEDWESHGDFERLLANVCLVRQRTVPDLMTALSCAKGVMTTEFCRTFAEHLMSFHWVGPDDFPDHLILCPAPSGADKYQRAELVDKHGQRSRFFYVESLPGHRGLAVEVPIPWEWVDSPQEKVRQTSGQLSNWFPIDCLKSAMSLQAIRISRARSLRPRSVLFEGSLLGGIDLKASMRAYVRGDENLYVQELPRTRFSQRSTDLDGYPVVWIFRTEAGGDMKWNLGTDGLGSFQPHVRDPERLARLGGQLEETIVHQVSYAATSSDARLSRDGCRVARYDVAGDVSFHPTVFTVKQAARWGENTDYARTPGYSYSLAKGGGFPALMEYYRRKHGIQPDMHDWKTALILMAIPCAKASVTVIAPDGYILSPIVYQEAARRAIPLHHVPLSYFPRDKMKEIAAAIMVPNLGRDPLTDDPIYPEHVGRVLRQTPTTYRNLVPRDVLYYGLDQQERQM